MKPSDVTPEAVQALAYLRLKARSDDSQVSRAINTLDNAGVFAALDEATDYASAAEIMAEVAAKSVEEVMGTPDPAEWGDTTAADMARHQGYAAASRLGKLERVPGTDTLRPARQTLIEDALERDEAQDPVPDTCPYTFAHTKRWCGYEGCRES